MNQDGPTPSDGAPFEGERARYAFHWLSEARLDEFDASGFLLPSWTHWLDGEGRFAKGISATPDPMDWSPDADLPREPCIVIDVAKLECPVHALSSHRAFWITQDLRDAQGDPAAEAAALEKHRALAASGNDAVDELFVEGPIGWACVVAVGYEGQGLARDAARDVAARRGLGLIDMNGWEPGAPPRAEAGRAVEAAVAAADLVAAARVVPMMAGAPDGGR